MKLPKKLQNKNNKKLKEEREELYGWVLKDLEKKEVISTMTTEKVVETLGRLLIYLTKKELEKMKKKYDGLEWNINFKNISLVSILELYDDQGETFETIEETEFQKKFQEKFFKIKEGLKPLLNEIKIKNR